MYKIEKSFCLKAKVQYMYINIKFGLKKDK